MSKIKVIYRNHTGGGVVVSRHTPTYRGLVNAYRTWQKNPIFSIVWQDHVADTDKVLELLKQRGTWSDMDELELHQWIKE